MEQTLHAGGPFLWSDLVPGRTQQVQEGQVMAEFWADHAPVKVPAGLIHDWIGAALIPGYNRRRHVGTDSGLR